MRLLDTLTLELRDFGTGTVEEGLPVYATFSHCSSDNGDEVSFSDLQHQHARAIIRKKRGYTKLEAACRLAQTFGIRWLWVDTACIDRSSSAELSESINSMFRWYSGSEVNFVFLGDLDGGLLDLGQDAEQRLRQCKWMRRTWTLQELIAPKDSRFYDKQWTPVGNKQTLLSLLSAVTRIDKLVLEDPACISDFSMGRRLSWAAPRSVQNVEDHAYALLGILGVNMSVLYGEGERAFIRLLRKAFKRNGDASVFVWESSDARQYRGPFAKSPAEFDHFAYRSETGPLRIRGEVRTGCGDIIVRDVFDSYDRGPGLVLCMAPRDKPEHASPGFGIILREWNGRYVRYKPQVILQLQSLPRGLTRKIRIRYEVDARTAEIIAKGLAITHNQPRIRRKTSRVSSRKSSPSSSGASVKVGSPSKAEERLRVSVPGDRTKEELQAEMVQWMAKRAEAMGPLKSESATPRPWGSRIPRRWGSHQSFVNRPQRRQHSRSPSTTSDSSRSDSLDESYLFDSSDEAHQLDPDHELAQYIQPLARLVREEFVSHVLQGQESGKHKRSLDDGSVSPRSRKRLRIACSDANFEVGFGTDSEDEKTVVVWTKRASIPRFNCHFCALHPGKHGDCLRADLLHIRDVKRHLYRYHLQPNHCPACQSVFPTYDAANKHIMTRSCSPVPGTVEGVTSDQLQELSQRPDPDQSPEGQWFSIWDTLFPDQRRPTSPYLVGEVGSAVSLAQDFWSKEGPSIISSFLRSRRNNGRDGDDDDDGDDMEALHLAVHDLMIDELLEIVKTEQAPAARRSGRTVALRPSP